MFYFFLSSRKKKKSENIQHNFVEYFHANIQQLNNLNLISNIIGDEDLKQLQANSNNKYNLQTIVKTLPIEKIEESFKIMISNHIADILCDDNENYFIDSLFHSIISNKEKSQLKNCKNDKKTINEILNNLPIEKIKEILTVLKDNKGIFSKAFMENIHLKRKEKLDKEILDTKAIEESQKELIKCLQCDDLEEFNKCYNSKKHFDLIKKHDLYYDF